MRRRQKLCVTDKVGASIRKVPVQESKLTKAERVANQVRAPCLPPLPY